MLETGEGVSVDIAEACRYYKLAADQGLARAQYNLGYMYEHGDGVPNDAVEAYRLYCLAAEQTHAAAQDAVGKFFTLAH
jgi:TPR repeat protein